jgi:hypothetical protein
MVPNKTNVFALKTFIPEAAGPEPTNTVLAASVFVLIIAMEFWDGIVAYISDCLGCITNADAGKVYCAATSPNAAWALFAAKKVLRQQMTPRTSRLGKQNTSCALVFMGCRYATARLQGQAQTSSDL